MHAALRRLQPLGRQAGAAATSPIEAHASHEPAQLAQPSC